MALTYRRGDLLGRDRATARESPRARAMWAGASVVVAYASWGFLAAVVAVVGWRLELDQTWAELLLGGAGLVSLVAGYLAYHLRPTRLPGAR